MPIKNISVHNLLSINFLFCVQCRLLSNHDYSVARNCGADETEVSEPAVHLTVLWKYGGNRGLYGNVSKVEVVECGPRLYHRQSEKEVLLQRRETRITGKKQTKKQFGRKCLKSRRGMGSIVPQQVVFYLPYFSH